MSARVGIEIAHSQVRVVEVSGTDRNGDPIVRKAAWAPLPGAADDSADVEVDAGTIRKNPAAISAVAAAITEAMSAAGVSRRTPVVLGISGETPRLVTVALPENLKQAERATALQNTPDLWPGSTLSAADAAFATDAITAPQQSARPGEREFNVAGVEQSHLETLFAVAELAKLRVRGVDLAPAATLRSMARHVTGTYDVQVLVDVGATQITSITRAGGDLVTVQVENNASVGGRALTMKVARALGLSFLDAELRKRPFSLAAASRPTVSSAADSGDSMLMMSRAAEDIARENATRALNDALDDVAQHTSDAVMSALSTNATYGIAQPAAIVLIGGGALQPGLQKVISNTVGGVIPVATGLPYASVKKNKRTAHPNGLFGERGDSDEPDVETLTRFATAIGLAMWEDPA